MPPTLSIVTRPFDWASLDRIDQASEAIVLSTAALGSFDERMLERLAERRALAVAVADGASLGGFALAAALACDWLALGAAVRLDLESDHAAASAAIIAGMTWRAPSAAFRLHVEGVTALNADEARSLDLADVIVPDGADPVQWAVDWIGGRSLVALNAGASLIRRRGDDALERAVFSLLFAAGEPRDGLRAFLEKRAARFENRIAAFS
ncbi:MAG TPA: hypothetical protein VEZ11_00645 [Thermoanaerobaculia bacterium]|nr:hypothetical protein [Thermoanaerobaculia bacterium]